MHPIHRLRTALTLGVALITTVAVHAADAGTSAPFSARSGVDPAADAAHTWAEDARLVYVENDEDVDATGSATRWGYLFYSERKGKARGYSVRDGKIYEAADLSFDFDAPPLSERWIDSAQALAAAEKKAGRTFRAEHGGRLGTMLLIRGAFHDGKPNATTWTVVYVSETEPALFVVVDAAGGNVVRTWRG